MLGGSCLSVVQMGANSLTCKCTYLASWTLRIATYLTQRNHIDGIFNMTIYIDLCVPQYKPHPSSIPHSDIHTQTLPFIWSASYHTFMTSQAWKPSMGSMSCYKYTTHSSLSSMRDHIARGHWLGGVTSHHITWHPAPRSFRPNQAVHCIPWHTPTSQWHGQKTPES